MAKNTYYAGDHDPMTASDICKLWLCNKCGNSPSSKMSETDKRKDHVFCRECGTEGVKFIWHEYYRHRKMVAVDEGARVMDAYPEYFPKRKKMSAEEAQLGLGFCPTPKCDYHMTARHIEGCEHG